MLEPPQLWMNSEYWAKKEDENKVDFIQRTEKQMIDYKRIVRERGLPIILNGEVHFSGNYPNLVEERERSGRCRFCSQSIPASMVGASMIKIIDPVLPNGFLDKGGVWAKCSCLTRSKKGGKRTLRIRTENKEENRKDLY